MFKYEIKEDNQLFNSKEEVINYVMERYGDDEYEEECRKNYEELLEDIDDEGHAFLTMYDDGWENGAIEVSLVQENNNIKKNKLDLFLNNLTQEELLELNNKINERLKNI